MLLPLLLACAPGPRTPEPGAWTAQEWTTLEQMRLMPPRPDPSNAFADSATAALLGQDLFFDPGLSGSGAFACAHCHDPARGFADSQVRSTAAGRAPRHSPAIPGNQYGPFFGWAGDTDSLWAQAAHPLLSPLEMASSPDHVAAAVQHAHQPAYTAAFGIASTEQPAETVFVNVLKALAAYERLLIPEPARFDAYLEDLDPDVLPPAAIRGLALFLRDANCVACHAGPMLTDGSFHTLGVPEPTGYDRGRTQGAADVLVDPYNCASAHSDTARCDHLVFLDPRFEDFRGAFKTPTLRNVTRTAPYFHTGETPDLEAVLTFYAELPSEPVVGHRELTLQPFELDAAGRADLVAFLETLASEGPAHLRAPREVR